MVQASVHSRKSKPLRKRLSAFFDSLFGVKQLLWRFTSAYLWLYGLAAIFGGRHVVGSLNQSVFASFSLILTKLGCAPSSPSTLSMSFKLLWIFCICSFSWPQIVGFFVFYVPFSPVLLFFPNQRKLYVLERRKVLAKPEHRNSNANRVKLGFAMVVSLLTWFSLFGHTSQRYPLIVAMLLCGLLFISRVQHALYFATPIHSAENGKIQRFKRACGQFLHATIEDIKAGKVSELSHLNTKINLCSWYLKLSRFVSRWLYGTPAKRRASLVVLVRFMFNLAVLGAISILFWAFAIRYALAPADIGFRSDLLASASRIIPGIPDATGIAVPAWVQVSASVSVWLIFVLYAGPVASLFPAFQERVIQQTASGYSEIRDTRKALYKVRDALTKVQQLAAEHPELEAFAKNVILLRKQDNLEDFLLTQPAYLHSLLEKPGEVDLLRTLGVPIPDIQALLKRALPQRSESPNNIPVAGA